jgi:hypothetical protein
MMNSRLLNERESEMESMVCGCLLNSSPVLFHLQAFPVEIIQNLYLGNASISSDLPVLEKHNIKHILNVTPDLPNVFEGTIRYLQIPISDHWTQSMLNHFVPAIQFIGEYLMFIYVKLRNFPFMTYSRFSSFSGRVSK